MGQSIISQEVHSYILKDRRTVRILHTSVLRNHAVLLEGPVAPEMMNLEWHRLGLQNPLGTLNVTPRLSAEETLNASHASSLRPSGGFRCVERAAQLQCRDGKSEPADRNPNCWMQRPNSWDKSFLTRQHGNYRHYRSMLQHQKGEAIDGAGDDR
jgi:hypothetical protein